MWHCGPFEIEGHETAILDRLALDLRPGYEPPMDYHNWDGHIVRGLERIDGLEQYCKEKNYEVDWFVVRAAYIGHDWLLTQTKQNPELLKGQESAEAIAAQKTYSKLREYGVSEELSSQVLYCILATNPENPCETQEAKATCRVDLGNTGDRFDEFFLNFVRVQIEDKRIDQLLLNPLTVITGAVDFISLYLRRSELSLGPDDNFPTDVEKNIARLKSMGTSAVRATVFRHLPIIGSTESVTD